MKYEILQERADAAGKSDEQFLIDYNAQTVIEKIHTVPMGIVDLHMKKSLYFKLKEATREPALPEIVHDLANAAILLPASPHIPTLDVWSDDFRENLDVLVYFGVFDQNDVQGLLALGTRLTSQSHIDHARETTQADLNVMRWQPRISDEIALRDADRLSAMRHENRINLLRSGIEPDGIGT